jgi:SAM-dependent methyltransferase
VRDNLFAKEPLEIRDGIRIFSARDRYTANYDRIADDHLKALQTHGENPWIPEILWQEMEATTISLIEKYSRPGQAILDVGVGLGRVLSHFPSLERHGMDISFEYLKRARGQGIDVCLSRIEDMPYRAGTFDIIVCTDVLEHVLDLNLCVQRILEALKPNGILLVRVPVYEDLSRYLDPSFPYELVHVRRFDEHSLRLLFERVFECRCEELTAGGYWPLGDRMKLTLPLARYGSIAFRIFRYIPLLDAVVYRPIVKRLYHPIDMNVVVRNSRVAGGVAATAGNLNVQSR